MRRPELPFTLTWNRIKAVLWIAVFVSPFVLMELDSDDVALRRQPALADSTGNQLQPGQLDVGGNDDSRFEALVAQADFTPEQKALYFDRLNSFREFLEENGHDDEFNTFIDWYLESVGVGAIDVLMDPNQPDLFHHWGKYQLEKGYRVGQPGYPRN